MATKNNNKCICLARVSTSKQSYNEQVISLIAAAKKDGYKDSNIIVIENKESGIKLDEEHRLGLVEMKEAILNDSSINCVYVREISRIGRRYDVLNSIKTFFIQNKIQLIVTDGNRKLLDDNGKISLEGGIIFEIACQVAQQEMIDKKERFAQGKREAVRNNKVIGSKILFGYTKDSNNVVVIDDNQANVVRYVFNAYANENLSTSEIFRNLKERGMITKSYSQSTGSVNFIRNIIINEAYKGGRSKTNKVYAFNYPAIVTNDIWEKANTKMADKCNKPLYNSKHVLYAKGLVECECGYKMIGNVDALLAYRCANNCMNVVNLNVIEHIAWTEAKAIKAEMMGIDSEVTIEQYRQQIIDNERKIDNIKEQIIKIDGSLSRAYKGYVLGGITENDYQEIVASINKERKAFQNSITNLQQTNANLQDLINRSDEFDTDIAYGGVQAIEDDNERRKIVKETIDKIVVSNYEDGKLITVIGKNGMKMIGNYWINKYFYKPSTRPKTYLAFDNPDGTMGYLEVTDQIVKRFKRRRYTKKED